jgi:NAD(P)-dependent dehydrogenase (short-subunit alcohol dehydrogenase family)
MPTAILTGVTGGWGRAVLDRFVERGWNVCATTRNADAEGLPDGVLAVDADLTDASSAERVVAKALERHGSVDALACVAGGFRMSGPLHESSPDDLRGQLAGRSPKPRHTSSPRPRCWR